MKKHLPNQNLKNKTNVLISRTAIIFVAILLSLGSNAQGTWSSFTGINNAYGTAIQLSDGTIMSKTTAGGGDGIGTQWNKLTPTASGSYTNGTWSVLPLMTHSRLYFASQVLKNGDVYVHGSEYGTGYGNKAGEVYHPLTNSWTLTPLPGGTVSDANSEILEDGRVLQAMVCCGLKQNIIFNPSTNTYSPAPFCIGIHNESAWMKLPDNSVQMIDRNALTTERYLPALNQWTVDAVTPSALYEGFGYEMGGALLLPDGRSWWVGGTPRTAYYTPSGTASSGTWTAGPDIPNNHGATDAAVAIMGNGKIICAVSPTATSGSVFKSPTFFYEFDYTTNTFTQLNLPCTAAYTTCPCYYFNFMNMPDGKLLISRQYSPEYFVYSPIGSPQAAWQPTLSTIMQNGCNSFTMTGKQFNGISQGSSYGDDWQNSTNYPLVRLTSTANVVYYARTSDWNSTGVARGNKADTAKFTTPSALPWGTYSLVVIANGIPSQPTLFTPYPYLTSTLAPPAVCSNSSFSYTPVGPKAGSAYMWTRDAVAGISNTAITTAQSSNPNEVLINTTSSPISVVYSYTSSANNCSTSQQVTVVVNPAPSVSVSPSSTICAGSNVNLTASGAVTFTWSNSSNNSTITVSPTTTTPYTVTGSNSFGCKNAKTTTVTVNPLPVLVTNGTRTICTGESHTITVSGGTSYLWFDSSTGSSAVVSPTANTWYSVTATNSFGCSKADSVQIIVDPCTGITEIGGDIAKNVDIYPNPAHESVTVAFSALLEGKYTIKLVDMTGKIVAEQNMTAIKGDNTYEMSLNGIAKGVYTIILEKGNSSARTKLSIK